MQPDLLNEHGLTSFFKPTQKKKNPDQNSWAGYASVPAPGTVETNGQNIKHGQTQKNNHANQIIFPGNGNHAK